MRRPDAFAPFTTAYATPRMNQASPSGNAAHSACLLIMPHAYSPCAVLPNAQIRKLVQDRIVGPESHTRPQRWFTRLLHATGLAKSIPLFHPVTESIYHKSYLGTAASHALVVANWTTELMARVPSPLERSKRNLLLFEVRCALKHRMAHAWPWTTPVAIQCPIHSSDRATWACVDQRPATTARAVAAWLAFCALHMLYTSGATS